MTELDELRALDADLQRLEMMEAKDSLAIYAGLPGISRPRITGC